MEKYGYSHTRLVSFDSDSDDCDSGSEAQVSRMFMASLPSNLRESGSTFVDWVLVPIF